MTEILFYHLQRRPLEAVLPGLLETCLKRDWRVVVQVGSADRLAALDAHLWTYDEASFLPHGTVADGHAESQPIFLADGPSNPNGAVVRFLVAGADPGDLDGYMRVVFLFEDRDAGAVEQAREHFRAVRAAGHDVTYWQQGDDGRWVKKG